ncbi:helix-turn-helix domain-containing protein [Pontibacter vulgaris]|uniref:helix-turn-helix domain-containing protein n=1 Tax=Pontibacter vulgaris TaxID=2905679 RepID=UPI001FA72C0B|nr:AraC family transcriptional regulator [Pontibacter vulgaris]
MKQTDNKTEKRPEEITAAFYAELDKHLTELEAGQAESTFKINDLAGLLHVHPTHLSNTLKAVTGFSPCDIYENKLMDIARRLLTETNKPVAEIARQLTYDPSNFSKFFKHFQGQTPKQFRDTFAVEIKTPRPEKN